GDIQEAWRRGHRLHGRGKRSSRSSRLGGTMEATALLKKDHATVKALFKQLEDAGDRAGQTKQRLFAEIKAGPDVHAAVGEEIFYPAMRKVRSNDTQDLVLEA